MAPEKDPKSVGFRIGVEGNPDKLATNGYDRLSGLDPLWSVPTQVNLRAFAVTPR